MHTVDPVAVTQNEESFHPKQKPSTPSRRERLTLLETSVVINYSHADAGGCSARVTMQQAPRSITQRTRNTSLLSLWCTFRAGIMGSKATQTSPAPAICAQCIFLLGFESDDLKLSTVHCARLNAKINGGKNAVLLVTTSWHSTYSRWKSVYCDMCVLSFVTLLPCCLMVLGLSLLARTHTRLSVCWMDGRTDGWWRKRHNGAALRKEIAIVHLLYCAELRIWRRKAAPERKRDDALQLSRVQWTGSLKGATRGMQILVGYITNFIWRPILHSNCIGQSVWIESFLLTFWHHKSFWMLSESRLFIKLLTLLSYLKMLSKNWFWTNLVGDRKQYFECTIYHFLLNGK